MKTIARADLAAFRRLLLTFMSSPLVKVQLRFATEDLRNIRIRPTESTTRCHAVRLGGEGQLKMGRVVHPRKTLLRNVLKSCPGDIVASRFESTLSKKDYLYDRVYSL
jgi:hypothetical protein